MAESFDPYHKWLGISPKDQPPNYYRLLSIELFESDSDVIEGAADRQMAHVRTFQTGQNSAVSQRILSELSIARLCLLDRAKKAAYDRQLTARLASQRPAHPLPPADAASAAGRPHPAPQPAPRPVAAPVMQPTPLTPGPAAPIVVADEQNSSSPIHRRIGRKTPLWRQPAVVGTAITLVLFASIGYFLVRRGQLPAGVIAQRPDVQHKPAAPPETTESPVSSDDNQGDHPRASAENPAPLVPPQPTPAAAEHADSAQPDLAPKKTTDAASEPDAAEQTPPAATDPTDRDDEPPDTKTDGAAESAAMAEDEPPQIAAADGGIDLLAQIDPARDGLRGKWRLADGELTTPDDAYAILLLPPPSASEYRLAMRVERLRGTSDLGMHLVVGESQVMAFLDAAQGTVAGLADVEGRHVENNESTRRGSFLPRGKPYDVVYTVRENSVTVEVDGEPAIEWSGDAGRLSVDGVYKLPDPTRLAVTSHRSVFRLSQLQLSPLSESGNLPARPPRRSFADMVSGKVESRQAIPDGETLKLARQELQRKLSSQLAIAKLADQKRSLARQLSQEAAQEGTSPRAYVLYRQAIELAEAVGDLDLAWQTADQFAAAFAVDGLGLRQQSLTEIGKTVKAPELAWFLADAASKLMAAALAAGDGSVVKKAAAQAQSFARRTKSRDLQKLFTSRANDALKWAGELEAVAAARERLAASPDDAAANQTVGHYELCAANDWNAALPELARSDDADWRKLAADELSLPNRFADSERQMVVADAWWTRAEEEPWPGRHYLRMRAARWYQAARASLVDVSRTRASERLKAMLAADEGLPAWDLFKLANVPPGQVPGEVVRIDPRRGGLETGVEYQGPINVTLVARTTGTRIRLSSHNSGWIWNYKLEPNRWHTVRFVITPFTQTVFVDDAIAFNDASRTARQLSAAPIAIFAEQDEIIEIKKFIVK